MTTRTLELTPARLSVGAVVGAIGGMMMAAFEMFWHGVITDNGIFTMPNMIATLAGFSMAGGFQAETIFGLMMHLGFSAFLGTLWALFLGRVTSVPLSLIAGLAYGAVLYWVMFYLVTPLVNEEFATMGRGNYQFAAHLIFGSAFLLYPLLLSSRSHR